MPKISQSQDIRKDAIFREMDCIAADLKRTIKNMRADRDRHDS